MRRFRTGVVVLACMSLSIVLVSATSASVRSEAASSRVMPSGKASATHAVAAADTIVSAEFDVPTSLDPDSPQLGHEPSDEAMAAVYETLLAYKFKTNPDGTRQPNYAAGL